MDHSERHSRLKKGKLAFEKGLSGAENVCLFCKKSKGIGSFTVNMMFLPRDDYNKILNGETVEEEMRLKKSYRSRIPGGKQKNAGKEVEEIAYESSNSEGEPSGYSGGLNKWFNYLKGQVKKLRFGYKELKNYVLGEIDEIKWNIKHLFHTLGLKYKKRKDQPKPWTNSSEEHQPQASTSSGSDDMPESPRGKENRPAISKMLPHPSSFS